MIIARLPMFTFVIPCCVFCSRAAAASVHDVCLPLHITQWCLLHCCSHSMQDCPTFCEKQGLG